MKKYFRDLIRELQYPDYGDINPIGMAMDLILYVDPFSLNHKNFVNEIMISFEDYLNQKQVDVEFALDDVSSIVRYLNNDELGELIKYLKIGSDYKINLLLLNAILKYQGKIYCAITKDYLFAPETFVNENFLVTDEKGKPFFDFDHPHFNILNFTYIMLHLHLGNYFECVAGESQYFKMIMEDDVDEFLWFLKKYNLDLGDYTNIESSSIVLDIISGGAKKLITLLDEEHINPFLYGIDGESVAASVLSSSNYEIIEKYFKLKPSEFKLEKLYKFFFALEEEVFQKVYALYPFTDIEYIMAYKEHSLVLSKHMYFLIQQKTFDINRLSYNVNVLMEILEKGEVDLIKAAVEFGGDLLLQVDILSNKKLLYKSSTYAHVFLNSNHDAINYIVDKIPASVMVNDLSPAAFLLDKQDLITLDDLIATKRQDPLFIKTHGVFLLNYVINEGLVDSYKYLINLYGPNALINGKVPVIHYVIMKKNDEMLDYLLQIDNLILNARYLYKTPGWAAIQEKYVYGVKRFVELGIISQDIRMGSPMLTLYVNKRKDAELYEMLHQLIPKYYFIKVTIILILYFLFMCLIIFLFNIIKNTI